MSAKNATAAKSQKAAANGNGQENGSGDRSLAAAIAYEQAIADEAQEIRDGAVELTRELFLQLLPLIRRPIPPGFITTTPSGPGKPYESTGIKSLQVQVDRLDNVLTPLNWSWYTEWSDDMRTADVVVHVWGPVVDEPRESLVTRRARGGVNQGSTDGNILKGSETNAAKLAFARLGVGHEIYLGAADFDPDTDPDAADLQTKTPQVETVDADRAAHLRDLFDQSELDAKKLQIKLGALGVTSARSVNAGIASLTPGQAEQLEEWLKGGEQS